MPLRLTIAIDGPAGSGKSTVARRVAAMLGYVYLDSGAMYRAVALKALERKVSLDNEDQLESLARETHTPVELVTEIYASERTKLERTARIKIYVPILIHRRVRTLLRERRAS